MMNLYSINFRHYAPKDSEEGIYTYLVAKDDEAVYEWIKSEPKIKNNMIFNSWKYNEDEKDFEIYDNNYNVIGKETFKERMIRLRGEMYDDDADTSDSYYGVTHIGWNLIKEDVTDGEVEVLISLGILQ